LGADTLRTGAAYEADRQPTRARLAASAEDRRVELGSGLVLVFETVDAIRTALEELLRADRVSDPGRVEAEAAAFGDLAGGPGALAAVLLVDVADPVALSDRLAELSGIAECVFLDIGGRRIPARADSGGDDSGAFHLLFDLGAEARAALLDSGGVTVAVEHPACRASVPLSADQVRAATADLRR
jgi:hypothetical protein